MSVIRAWRAEVSGWLRVGRSCVSFGDRRVGLGSAPGGGLPLEQGTRRVVAQVEGPEVLEAVMLVVAMEADIVSPHVDPDPVVAEVSGSLASPLDHVGAESGCMRT
jgi:hypothetical protein